MGGGTANSDGGMATTPGHVVVRLQLPNATAALAERVVIEIIDAGVAVLNAPEGAIQSATYEVDVQPGTWSIEVRNDDNQLVGASSVGISPSGIIAAQPVISIVENTPMVTKLNRHSGLPGDTVVATGLHLNRIRGAAFTGATQATVMATGTASVAFVIPPGAMTGPLDVTYLSTAKRVQASDYFSIRRVYYVRSCLADGGSCPPDGGSGISFDDALRTVPDVNTGVQQGSEIWIAEGTYVVPRTLRFVETTVLGGFSATNPERNPSLRTPMTHITTLDGNNSVGIAIAETFSANVSVDGIHFTRGIGGTSTSMNPGAALTVNNPLTISRCSFYGHINKVIVSRAQLVMRDCVIRDNRGSDSSTVPGMEPTGVFIGQGNLTAERCSFINNMGSGPLSTQNDLCSVQLRDCVFDSNRSSRGTMDLFGSASIERTLLLKNIGGIRYEGSSNLLTLRSVVFLGMVREAMTLHSGTVVAENVVWIGSNFAFQTLINQLGGSLSLVNNTFSQNTSAISSSGGTRAVTNTLFYQTPNPFSLNVMANAQGNIDLPVGSLSPFLRVFSVFDTATLWGPDAIPFTRDDAYVLVPSNANELIDKGVSTGAQVDIHGTPRPLDHPGVISGSNGTTFDIGASEAL